MYQPERGPWFEIKERPGRIKVGLVGTCSVGKTSIIRYFEEKYKGMMWPPVAVVPEAATLFFGNPKTTEELIAIERQRRYGDPPADMMYYDPSHPRKHWRTQWQLMNYGNYLYDKAVGRYGLVNPAFVCDRVGSICAPVFVASEGDLKHSHLMVTEGVAYAYWRTYTHIGLVDPEGVPYEQNDIRDETPEQRMEIHREYLQFFDRYNIPFKLITGTLRERIAQVEELLTVSTP